MAKLENKVAFITGAARGQGRSHAVRLAEEGADIIAVDSLADLATIDYPMATEQDMKETAAAVEATGRRIHVAQADVRDFAAVQQAYRDGVAALGPVDIVLANAGVCPLGSAEPDPVQTFHDVIGVNLIGAWNTAFVAGQDMIDRGEGGAIVLTSSTQGLSGRGADGSAGMLAYGSSKHGMVGLMRGLANWLSPHNIRVNTVHPTGVATPMVENDAVGGLLASDPQVGLMAANLMPVGMVESIDITNAVLYLVSDDARYVTGVTLPVDGGFVIK